MKTSELLDTLIQLNATYTMRMWKLLKYEMLHGHEMVSEEKQASFSEWLDRFFIFYYSFIIFLIVTPSRSYTEWTDHHGNCTIKHTRRENEVRKYWFDLLISLMDFDLPLAVCVCVCV